VCLTNALVLRGSEVMEGQRYDAEVIAPLTVFAPKSN
jgi:hypothetical protein